MHKNVQLAKCKICDQVFKAQRALDRHTENQHQPANIRTCAHCGRIYANRAELYHHYQNDHPNIRPNPIRVDMKYVCQCQICDGIYNSMGTLYR